MSRFAHSLRCNLLSPHILDPNFQSRRQCRNIQIQWGSKYRRNRSEHSFECITVKSNDAMWVVPDHIFSRRRLLHAHKNQGKLNNDMHMFRIHLRPCRELNRNTYAGKCNSTRSISFPPRSKSQSICLLTLIYLSLLLKRKEKQEKKAKIRQADATDLPLKLPQNGFWPRREICTSSRFA